MAIEQEVWEQLNNETGADFEKFLAYRSMPPGDRSVLGAYRVWSGNPTSKSAGDTFIQKAEKFMWPDRARAYDVHLERVRQRGIEAAIEDEARKGQVEAEQVRGRMHELLSTAYDKALQWMHENEGTFRPQDVVQIIKLHIEAADKFPVDRPTGESGDTWTEDDDREICGLVEEVFSERAGEAAEERQSRSEKEDPPEG